MKRIFVTGDTHGDGFDRFKKAKYLEADILIILGDFGYVWNNPKTNDYNLNIINNKKILTLFIDGNHEDFELLNKYPMKHWNGGWVHELRPNVLHLMRGETYTIEGKTFAVMGGANSTDKKHRTNIVNWWKEELPNKAERQNLIDNLEVLDWKVDYMLSHTAPSKVLKEMNADYRVDDFTDFLDNIENKLEYDSWFFGHMHEYFKSKNRNCTCLYSDFVKLN
jgi:predicted phosphodiesterase